MKGLLWPGAVVIAAAALSIACGMRNEDDTPQPQAVTFSGKVDPQFVGDWRTQNGRSELDLAKGGRLKIFTVFATPKGDDKASFDGAWLISSEGNLLLKYTVPHQSETKLKYKTKLEGSKMTLVQNNGINEVYIRRSAKK